MKKILLATLVLLISANVATADMIGVYTDPTGWNCVFSPGFTSAAYVVHKYTGGATGSRFKVTLPVGSSFFAFNTPFVPFGNLTNDLSLGYGQCLVGTISLGTIVAILASGPIRVQPADAFPFVIYTSCVFAELPAYGDETCVTPYQCCTVGTETTTWGRVKALYR